VVEIDDFEELLDLAIFVLDGVFEKNEVLVHPGDVFDGDADAIVFFSIVFWNETSEAVKQTSLRWVVFRLHE
jgi:hypothetical protein